MIQKQKQKQKAKLQRKAKLEYINQSSPPLKRETNFKLPSQASKLSLVKWFGYQCGEYQYHLSHNGHARSESRLLCALSLSGGLSFWLRLWHWCYHKTKTLA
jgi:hypothetical protein